MIEEDHIENVCINLLWVFLKIYETLDDANFFIYCDRKTSTEHQSVKIKALIKSHFNQRLNTKFVFKEEEVQSSSNNFVFCVNN